MCVGHIAYISTKSSKTYRSPAQVGNCSLALSAANFIRSLKGLEIPYEVSGTVALLKPSTDHQSFDLVIDEQAKTRWQRAKPPGVVVGLPGYLVGGEWVGVRSIIQKPA